MYKRCHHWKLFALDLLNSKKEQPFETKKRVGNITDDPLLWPEEFGLTFFLRLLVGIFAARKKKKKLGSDEYIPVQVGKTF